MAREGDGMVALDTRVSELIVEQIGGEVPGELDLSHVPAKEARRLDRTIALAVVAAREALEGSKLSVDESNCERIGVSVGSGIGGLETIEQGVDVLAKSGPRRVPP